MLSVKDVERILGNHFDGNGWDSAWNNYIWSHSPLIIDGLGEVKVTHDGGEGQGSDAEILFVIGDRYFIKYGSYASHDGFYMDGPFNEVEPYQELVTLYRKKA